MCLFSVVLLRLPSLAATASAMRKSRDNLCFLQMMREWAKETCWRAPAQRGGMAPRACTSASLTPSRWLSKSTRLEKFGQNQCGLLSALIKHGTEKGDPRSFYMQASLLASTCCSLRTLQPLAAWLQIAYGQHMRAPVGCWDLGSP